MKRASIFTLVFVGTISLFLINCDSKPTEPKQNNSQTEPFSLKKSTQELGPHAYNTFEYLTGKAELSSEEIKILLEKQEELGMEPDEKTSTSAIKLLKPEEFPEYNLTYPSDLDIIKRGMKTAQHAEAIPTSKTQQPCGDCSDCHEGGGQPADWYYWSELSGKIQGNYKIVEGESVSLSETFCIDRIAVDQFVYQNGNFIGHGYIY